MQICYDAVINLLASHDRSFYSWDKSMHQRQLTKDEIAKLAERLEHRFQSWTGFSLASYRDKQ